MSTTVFPRILDQVNDSFTQGIFPECLKLAVVTPIIKNNNGDRNKSKNYRPLISLSFLSKILERIMYNQLISHLDRSHLPPSKQTTDCSTHVKLLCLKLSVILKFSK